jgi:hypothetical protein
MRRIRGLLALVCCLLLGVLPAGCGGDDGDDTTPRSGAPPAEVAEQLSGEGEGSEGAAEEGGKSAARPEKSDSGSPNRRENGADGAGGPPVSPDAIDNDGNGVPEGFEVAEGEDESVQTYGAEASGGVEDEVVTAMREFFGAMLARDYVALCDGIATPNREQFENLLKEKSGGQPCSALLPQIYKPDPEEVRNAIQGQVYQVRTEGDNAFVLFTPLGGSSRFFVMVRDNGDWKANSLTPGTPLIPGS